VRSQATLKGGDRLKLGPCEFVVVLGAEDAAAVKTQGGADPLAATMRARDLPRLRPAEGKKEEGHPQGDAGGPGDSTG
jgi:hypothetical protein